MKVFVRGDYVLVAPIERKSTESVMFIVDSLDQNSQGVIVYSGCDVPKDLTPGLKVIFDSHRFPIPIDGKILQAMKSENIVAVMSE